MYLYLEDISLWSLLIHQHFIFTTGDTILEITNTKYLKTEKNKKKYKEIQLVQINVKYGDQVYLPYSVGILQSYVNQNSFINDNVKFLDA